MHTTFTTLFSNKDCNYYFLLFFSRVMLTYLSDKYGKDDSLYPKDLQKRARIDQLLYFDLEKIATPKRDYFVSNGEVFELRLRK